MKVTCHVHMQGDASVPNEHTNDLVKAIESIDFPLAKGSSTSIRSHILYQLRKLGWSGEIPVSPTTTKISISSIRDKTGLCVQTGNVSRMYADLLKLQTMYLEDSINCGAYILPSAIASKKLGSNVANSGRLLRELPLFKKVITIPLVIAAFGD